MSFMSNNPRLDLDRLYAFARANTASFATTERFRPCGRLVTADAPPSTIGYEVATYDMDALMRAYVQTEIRRKIKTGTFRALGR